MIFMIGAHLQARSFGGRHLLEAHGTPVIIHMAGGGGVDEGAARAGPSLDVGLRHTANFASE